MSILIWNAPALQAFFRAPGGAIARDLAARAVRVETAAKLNASGRPGPNVQTGRLRASISWTLGEDAISLYALIGTDVEYASYVEFGTDRAPAYPYLRPALVAARF